MTERTALRQVTISDLESMRLMDSDSRVMTYTGGIKDSGFTQANLKEHELHWQRYGFGSWLVTYRQTGQVMGRVGLRHQHLGGQDVIELGYLLLQPFWGQGLATELVERLVGVADDNLRCPLLAALIADGNLASIAVARKFGFQPDSLIQRATAVYRLWLRTTPGSRPDIDEDSGPQS